MMRNASNASKGSKKGSKKGTSSPRKGKGKTSSPVVPVATQGDSPVRRPVGKIVDVTSPDELQRQIASLLGDLHNATTRTQKKGIRRALRTRGYFISQSGGGLSRNVPASPASK